VTARRHPRHVLLGLDAADLGLIEAHRASLPALRRVLDTAAVSRLTSTADLLTGSVWPTFATATLPGAHGVYHHLQWDAGAMRLRRVAADWLDWEPFWLALERRGLDVAVLDVPMTYPGRLVRGIEVTNWGSHDQLGPFGAPRTVGAEIRRRFGSAHPMGAEIPVDKTPAQLARIRRDLVAGAALKGDLVRWLLGQRDWDVFLAVFGETHRGGHILWPDGDGESLAAVLDVYRAVDGALGGVLEAVPRDATVIVFSLHGMGRNTSQEHFVPRLVQRLNAAFDGASGGAAGAAPPADRGVVRWLRGRVPASVQNAIARAVPVAVRDEVMNRQITGGRDWAHTPGFALLADLNGYLRLNVRGRERDGLLVEDGEVLRRYVAAMKECFTGLRVADTGEPVTADVVLARDAFPGPRVDRLPDVIVRWSGVPPASRVRSDRFGEIGADLATGRGGNHRPEGFCAVMGPAGSRAHATGIRHIADLASLVLRLD
jgi:predicted AlkP superfamily phosphohydrolase/phosphomutase